MTRSENPSVSGARPEQANSSRANDSVAPPLRPGKQGSFDIRRQCNAAAPQMPFLLLALAACGGGGGGGGGTQPEIAGPVQPVVLPNVAPQAPPSPEAEQLAPPAAEPEQSDETEKQKQDPVPETVKPPIPAPKTKRIPAAPANQPDKPTTDQPEPARDGEDEIDAPPSPTTARPGSTDTIFVILLGRTPVVGATVYEDRDGDGQLSPQERQTPVGVTGPGGLVTVPTAAQGKRHLAYFRKPVPDDEPAPDSDQTSKPPASPHVPELGMWGLVAPAVAPAQKAEAGREEDRPVLPRVALLMLEFSQQPGPARSGGGEDRFVPRIRLLIATDSDAEETTASLGFSIKGPLSAAPTVLRGRQAAPPGKVGPVVDLPANKGAGTVRNDDLVLDSFLARATHVLSARYGYLLVYFDPEFTDLAPDGGGAWIFAYFTPAHLGYDGGLLSAERRLAIEGAFAGLKTGGAALDGFVFTATTAAGEAVSVPHQAAVVGVNDAPGFRLHGDKLVSVVENTEPGEMLDVLIADTVPDGFTGLQISDPDAGDEVTLHLATGKDAGLFELVRVGDGRFALMWKAGADGRRKAPDFERTGDNNYRISHDDDGIFGVDIVTRDSGGHEITHSVEVAILDDVVEPPWLHAVRAAGQTGPIAGRNYTRPGASGEVYFNGEDPVAALTLSVWFADKPAKPLQIMLRPVPAGKFYRINDRILTEAEYLRLNESRRQSADEYKGHLYKLADHQSSLDFVFNGQYGAATLSPYSETGYLDRLKWVYAIHADYGSGSPFNRIGPGVKATETITFVVGEGVGGKSVGGEGVGGEGGRRATHTISLELVGNHDRPVIVSETAASGASGGFLPDTHARLWAWWQDKFIIQRTSKDRAEQKSVLLEPGLDTSVWRFLAQAGLLVAVLGFYPL